MDTSSPRFKSIAVSAGISFWFFIITSSAGMFHVEHLLIFSASVLLTTQVFASKISRGLETFAIINTKIFLGALYVTVVSIYGASFKLLRIDLLRLKNQNESYWLNIESTSNDNRKQY